MKKNIPMTDLHLQYTFIKKEIDAAIADVVTKSSFIGGDYVKQLEQKIANYCNTKYAVALNSGTDALFLSLWALGITKGDEVITTPFTFFATVEAIALVGAKPVFVDINPETFNIDSKKIESRITKKTKAIIPVHMFGQPAEMDKITSIAKKHTLFVVEDACQAIGAEYNNKKIGGIGDVGCFSFFPSKNLGAFGDGGMITTNNKDLAEKIAMLRNHGSKIKYQNEIIGTNSRLDSIQAAILLAKLPHLNIWNQKRRKTAETYSNQLKNIPWIEIPKVATGSIPVYNQYTIKIKNEKRDLVREYLKQKGISTMVYYPQPLHLLSAMAYLHYKKNSLPKAENTCQEVLSLPIYPDMKKSDILYICKLLKNYV